MSPVPIIVMVISMKIPATGRDDFMLMCF